MAFDRLVWKIDLELIIAVALAVIIIIYSLRASNALRVIAAVIAVIILMFLAVRKRKR